MLDDPNKTIHAVGGLFRWGSGLLGKSAIAVVSLDLGLLVVGFSLHSDWAKIVTMTFAVSSFFLWYFPFLRFCESHPADALLEGQHWAAHQQVVMGTKGAGLTVSGAIQLGAAREIVGNPALKPTEA